MSLPITRRSDLSIFRSDDLLLSLLDRSSVARVDWCPRSSLDNSIFRPDSSFFSSTDRVLPGLTGVPVLHSTIQAFLRPDDCLLFLSLLALYSYPLTCPLNLIRHQLITPQWWSLQTSLQRYITVNLVAKASHPHHAFFLYRWDRNLSTWPPLSKTTSVRALSTAVEEQKLKGVTHR